MSTWVVVRRKRANSTLGHLTSSQFDVYAGDLDQSDQLSGGENDRSHASAKYSHYVASRWQALALMDPIPNQVHYSIARRALKKFDSSYFFAGYNQPRLREKFLFLRKFLYGWRARGNDPRGKRID